MLAKKVKDLIRIRNILLDEKQLISEADSNALARYISYPVVDRLYNILEAIDKELDEIKECLNY